MARSARAVAASHRIAAHSLRCSVSTVWKVGLDEAFIGVQKGAGAGGRFHISVFERSGARQRSQLSRLPANGFAAGPSRKPIRMKPPSGKHAREFRQLVPCCPPVTNNPLCMMLRQECGPERAESLH